MTVEDAIEERKMTVCAPHASQMTAKGNLNILR